MKILLLEDDHLQAKWLQDALQDKLNELRPAVETVRTEREFQSRLDELVRWDPTVVLLDAIVRWTDPSPDLMAPPDGYNGPGRAGVRCAKLFAEASPHTPIILYTILEREDLEEELVSLPRGVQHLRKEADLSPLLDRIRAVVQRRPS